MRIRIPFALTLWLLFTGLSAQESDVREEVFLHLNSSYLLTGETMYFSGFVKGKSSGEFSSMSKILYVELVGENDKPVFQQKIKLDSGRGHGHFFIPSLVATGQYQLLAYTRWMRNFDDYFQAKITIVNPFEEYRPEEAQEEGEKITFYPEGGKLVSGVENLIVYQIGRGEKFTKGKIVAENGESAYEFNAEVPVGRFSFKPNSGEDYQVIMEDEDGNFHFQNFPEVSGDTRVIQVHEGRNAYEIRIAGTNNQNTELRVANIEEEIFHRTVEPNAPVRIPKGQLKRGFYQVSTTSEERTFYHADPSIDTDRSAEKQVFGPRSLVQLPVRVEGVAEVSVSVRKKDPLNANPAPTDGEFFGGLDAPAQSMGENLSWADRDNLVLISGNRKQYFEQREYVNYLPDLRGQMLSGQLQSANGNTANQTIIHAIIGEEYQLATTITDKDGRFSLQLDPLSGNRNSFLTVHGETSRFSFDLDDDFLDKYPPFKPGSLELDSVTINRLIDRSIRNQIENAYYDPDKDSTVRNTNWITQFSEFSHFYYLDDYNRFPSLYESFIEYIPVVAARKRGDKLKIFPRHPIPNMGAPLILIDGLPTTAERILAFSPYKIESIGVINNRYFLGALTVDGVVAFHTYEKDLMEFSPGENTAEFDYQGLELTHSYSFPRYDKEGLERIPDYRDQLYWNPGVKLSEDAPYILSFFTSDSQGVFEIDIQGFDKDGEPVSIKKYIEVRKPNQQASN